MSRPQLIHDSTAGTPGGAGWPVSPGVIGYGAGAVVRVVVVVDDAPAGIVGSTAAPVVVVVVRSVVVVTGSEPHADTMHTLDNNVAASSVFPNAFLISPLQTARYCGPVVVDSVVVVVVVTGGGGGGGAATVVVVVWRSSATPCASRYEVERELVWLP